MSESTPIETIPYSPWDPPEGIDEACQQFFELMQSRRSVRHFSSRPVPRSVIERIVATAGTAPSGANKQPWRFVCVQNQELKRKIRVAAEAEENEFYGHRAPQRWLDDLEPLGTDAHKPFLETAPWLIVVFKLTRGDEGDQVYYINESVGIATGLLLAAIHHAGLVALTHTPSPMRFLSEVLGRPATEKPFLLIPVGYPTDDCRVPDIERKPLDSIMIVDSETP